MRRFTIITLIVTSCCLFTCISRHDNGNDSTVHIKSPRPEEPADESYDWRKNIFKEIHIDEPRIDLLLFKYKLKDGPIKIPFRILAFGPDSLMTRVIDLGPYDPFAPEFALSFFLLAPDTVTIDLQDVKRADTNPIRLFCGYLDAGQYRLSVRETDLPASLYSFQCTVGDTTKSGLPFSNQ
jgi:hypothetical protein